MVRSLLATSPPTVAASFVSAARSCLTQSHHRGHLKPAILFEARDSDHGRRNVVPTPNLNGLLSYTRSLYGAGMGFESIEILSGIVRSTSGLRWTAEDDLAQVLAVIDADISQAIQSCREEMGGGHIRDISGARAAMWQLRTALTDCRTEVDSWGGEFPFSRGKLNADCLQL